MQSNQFHALSEAEQARFLAMFGHLLTIVAREGYEVGTDGLSHPALLRHLNEIQHRVLGAITARLSATTERYPDDVLVAIMTKSAFPPLTERLQGAYDRAWQLCAFESHSSQSDGTQVASQITSQVGV